MVVSQYYLNLYLNAVNFYKNKGFKILKKQLNADSKFFEYIMEYN